jgi:hypothetical protein
MEMSKGLFLMTNEDVTPIELTEEILNPKLEILKVTGIIPLLYQNSPLSQI